MGVPMKKTTKPLTVRQQYKKDYDRLFKEIGRDGGLWSQAVHAIHGHKCAICGLPSQAAHHFFGKKAYPSVRFNLDNGCSLCRGLVGTYYSRGSSIKACRSKSLLIHFIGTVWNVYL